MNSFGLFEEKEQMEKEKVSNPDCREMATKMVFACLWYIMMYSLC